MKTNTLKKELHPLTGFTKNPIKTSTSIKHPATTFKPKSMIKHDPKLVIKPTKSEAFNSKFIKKTQEIAKKEQERAKKIREQQAIAEQFRQELDEKINATLDVNGSPKKLDSNFDLIVFTVVTFIVTGAGVGVLMFHLYY